MSEARAATAPPWVAGLKRAGEPGRWRGVAARSVLADRTWLVPDHELVADSPSAADVDYIVRHDPARVLREIEAKRAIVAEYERAHTRPKGDVASAGALLALHGVVKHLAAVYADHPSYRVEWRP